MNKRIFAFVALIAAASAGPLNMKDEWENYKTDHNKSYAGREEYVRFNIFVSTRNGVETHNQLYDNKLVSYRRVLDEWADAKLKEITVPGADKVSAVEWNEYKEKYNKTYSGEEDEFRRTIYSRRVDFINDFNKLYENGIESFSLRINQFTDNTMREGPATGLIFTNADLPRETYEPVTPSLPTEERPKVVHVSTLRRRLHDLNREQH